MRSFIMDDRDFDFSTAEGRSEMRKAVEKAARKVNPTLSIPHGGSKGGIGRGRIVHNGTVHSIK